MTVQPVWPPATIDDFAALARSGRLVSLDGRPLRLHTCTSCGAPALGETCPKTLVCPSCSARPGGPCVRPSGHEYWAGRFHVERYAAAETADRARQQAGDPTVPAPWPPATLF